jgi:ABC-type protease/lipase transport system fused ATPase/permease subunit
MRGYVCLSILFGGFIFLTIQYSLLVAFGVMYCIGMLVVIVTAFVVGYSKKKRSRTLALADQPVYPAGKELVRARNLHAV